MRIRDYDKVLQRHIYFYADNRVRKPQIIQSQTVSVLVLESGYLTTLYSCDDCQRRVPISCVRRQASDP